MRDRREYGKRETAERLHGNNCIHIIVYKIGDAAAEYCAIVQCRSTCSLSSSVLSAAGAVGGESQIS